ncbi:DUF2752 domain-containing protein [Phycicoccus sonneratiae]|uniref:DUF2752 domain-containing protein n=1 Tax=Phycicoccus sonneratiae TaxID=2807628 RepID=A0ABS2CNM1_9MICO|nr:DUF2752 domain-containing protein [Phycicoccus sonneraticus]MBM6401489.1 DUF2752 domain-containing protein [Phycicoccus sonneraticus]
MTLAQRQAASTRSATTRWRRLLPHATVAAGVLAATSYVWAVDPNRPGHYPVCPTYALAGIYCPGCGMLRATHDLTHLDVAGAMQRNPLAVPLYLGVVVLFGLWVRAAWRGEQLRWDPPRWMPALLGVSFVVLTVARNVPGWTWLSPA